MSSGLLRKRLRTSKHPLREDIILCIFDLLDDGDDDDDDDLDETKDWVRAINRGGLTLVNNATYEVLVVIEEETRRVLGDREEITDEVRSRVAESEEVEFYWSVVCG